MLHLAGRILLVSPEVPSYPYGNCLYIDDEVPTIIDMGAGGRAFADVPREQIRLGLLSHFHFDHLHGSGFFPAAELKAGWQEAPAYTSRREYIVFQGYHLWDELMPGVEREHYGEVIPLPDDVPVQPGFREVPLAGTFNDREIIKVGKTKIQAIHLPGHTFGHYGFWFEEEDLLFSGDIDLVPTGPWYNNHTGDVGDLIYSVKRIKEINPRILVPSHRRVQTKEIFRKLDAFIQIVLDREDQILELLKTPSTIFDLAKHQLVYREPGNMYQEFWEKMTIKNHLKHLIEIGAAREIEKGIFART